MKKIYLILLLFVTSIFAYDDLDIRILRVEFLKENPNNSLTTGDGAFNSDSKDYKLDPKGERGSKEYWESHLKFAENYFKASGSKVSLRVSVFPEKPDSVYRLDKDIISYNRTSRKKGEKLAEFDSAKAADYARFVNDVLDLAKKDADGPLDLPVSGKRVILIAHAGSNRLIDGGTMGSRGANTPGDFTDAYIDTTWGDFWRGFEVDAVKGDTIRSVIVSSETASQDGLNWGINGTITSQIGRELGLPYSFDVVKGFSRLGYFDGMDFAGYNAGNGFFPSLPSAWHRYKYGWTGGANFEEVSPSLGKKVSVEICAASCNELCVGLPQIVKIPINHNEYILLENRQRTCDAAGNVSVEMDSKKSITIPVDSLYSYFLDSASQKEKGVIEFVSEVDAALPASGVVAWRVNDWYVNELLPYGAINAWNGDTFRDHQFGISLLEADGVLGLGKEFSAAGESVFYFGSGSDLIPHKKFSQNKQFDTVFSINPLGYSNTASTFGGYSGIKITAKIPSDAKVEKSFNSFTGDSVITWRAIKIPVEIEWVGKYAIPVSMDALPFDDIPTEKDFEQSKISDFNLDRFKDRNYNLGKENVLPIYADINNDGVEEIIFLGNNRLYAVDTNGVPLPNFPVLLSNGEPFTDFNSKPMYIDIDGDGSLEILIPTNNGLILAVNNKGKLLKEEFPIVAGTFSYEDSITKQPMLLLQKQYKDSTFLFAMHRDSIKAFYLPSAKEFTKKEIGALDRKDEISEFFIYPNPIRNGKAAMRFRILNTAKSANLEVFDITGHKVFSHGASNVTHGSNQIEGLDFSKLGSDIYSARLTVKFDSGKRVEKWVRIGVIR